VDSLRASAQVRAHVRDADYTSKCFPRAALHLEYAFPESLFDFLLVRDAHNRRSLDGAGLKPSLKESPDEVIVNSKIWSPSCACGVLGFVVCLIVAIVRPSLPMKF
jgi:hypothetical protein